MKRIEKIRAEVETRKIDALLITNPIDLFWATGLQFSAGSLVVGDETYLIVDGRYREVAEASGISLKDELKLEGQVGFDSATTTYDRFQSWKGEMVPLPNIMQELRAIKDEEEIVALRKAGLLAEKGADFVSSLLQSGITEREVAQELEIFWLKNGGERLSFDPIIAFGDHSARPHHRVTDRKLDEGDVVLCDMGVQVDHYQSDLTRVPWKGEMEEVYAIVEGAKEAAQALCRPGTKIADLDKAAREVAKEGFCHSLGHGVGLEVHELPSIKKIEGELAVGMVITIEPGVYILGKGGVRLEDTLLITEEGFENFTQLAS